MNPLPGDLFSRRLRQERERQSISQAELARRIAEVLGTRVDPSAVTRIEQQTRAVRLDEAVAAAEALDVPLSILLSDDPMADNEADLQQALVDLTLAQREWENNRLEVLRLTQVVQILGGGLVPQSSLDQEHRDAIDARIPRKDQKSTGPDEGPVTDPDE